MTMAPSRAPSSCVWWATVASRVTLANQATQLVRGCRVERTWAQALEEVGSVVGSVIKKRRKRMAKKKHRKLLKRTRVQRRNKK